jgi:cell division protein FtsB
MKAPLKKYAYALAFLLLASYAFIALRGPRGVAALLEKQAEIRRTEARIQTLMDENQRKRVKKSKLETDPELDVREQLKVARPGEKVFVIGESNAAGKK